MLRVATSTGRSGYVRDILVLPAIPVGSPMIVSPDFTPDKGKTAEAFMRPKRGGKATIAIACGTRVSALAVAPNGQDLSPYQALVLSGAHRHARGWFDVFSLRAPSPPTFAGEYEAKCGCVTLYLTDPNEKPTPAPSPSPAPLPSVSEDEIGYMREACKLMYDGADYAYDNEDSVRSDGDLHVVACKQPGGDMMYFRREHLASTKADYIKDPSPPTTPIGFVVPPPGTADATPFPLTSKDF